MRRLALSARLQLGVALAVAALPISCGGCERRVEEPLPSEPPRAVAQAASSSLRAVEPPAGTLRPRGPDAPGLADKLADKPSGKRCVRESPPVAKRPVPKSPDPACPKDPEKPPALRTGKVTFEGREGSTITVEIAENDHDRQRGLMYRKSMSDARGMIFWFEEKSNHSFWMHNTCIPLDMLYIDDDGLIVGIEENTPTLSDDTFEVGCESKYVLEVNAGWTRVHGVKAGQRVRIEGI
jgi:uncharacterized membrane protein (UPF0127 family)